ncbi:MAG: hypothetical protein HYZ57_06230 [Acidobacteria bacterium]|nr:hypothetical protein [Acidobacteriota bacterium]
MDLGQRDGWWSRDWRPLSLYAAAAGALIAAHAPFLKLPYFWDELGQFVPAALDILYAGAWVPRSTVPNAHPPGVMAYLAAVWAAFGYSVGITRAAMLAVAAAGLVAVALLARELTGGAKGHGPLWAAALLFASPLFYAQSMMAQLDMPAMVFTTLALWLFLTNRTRACAGVCVALVMVKETGATAPLLFGLLLARERRWREAALFLLPFMALGTWLLYLRAHTGHLFGDSGFTRYNLWFPLHPVRLGLNFARRIFYLFIDNFHWIGTAAIVLAGRRTRLFRTRGWAVTGALFAANVVVVTIFGGAALERYLLPALPVFYMATAAAWTVLSPGWRRASQAGMILGLLAGSFVNSPFPFALENNLAFTDFVRLHREAARFIESHYRGRTVTSAWPFPDAMRRPEFGYVREGFRVRGIADFHRESVWKLQPGEVELFVLYSRTWEPRWGALRFDRVQRLLARYYYYEVQVSGEELDQRFGLERAARWERRGQWVEVHAADGGSGGPAPDAAGSRGIKQAFSRAGECDKIELPRWTFARSRSPKSRTE